MWGKNVDQASLISSLTFSFTKKGLVLVLKVALLAMKMAIQPTRREAVEVVVICKICYPMTSLVLHLCDNYADKLHLRSCGTTLIFRLHRRRL